MTINVYPTPSTSGTSLPAGATSLLVDGIATRGGFTYSSSSITAGTRIFYANNNNGNIYHVNMPNSLNARIITDGSYTVVRNSTTESQFTFTNLSSPRPTMTMTTTMGGLSSWTSQAGLLSVIRAQPRAAIVRWASDYLSWTTVFQFTSFGTVAENGSGVLYGNGRYLAFESLANRPYYFSTNGTNWTSQAARGANAALWRFDGQHFIVFNNNGLQISTDGINWTSKTGTALGSVALECSPNGAIWLNSNASIDSLIRSTDKGTTWTTQTIPGPSSTTGQIGYLGYTNGLFVVGGRDVNLYGMVAVSSDGLTWTYKTIALTTTASYNVYADNGLFFAGIVNSASATAYPYYSTDGINWVTAETGFAAGMGDGGRRLVWDSQKFIFIGNNNSVITSAVPYYAVYNMASTTIN